VSDRGGSLFLGNSLSRSFLEKNTTESRQKARLLSPFGGNLGKTRGILDFAAANLSDSWFIIVNTTNLALSY
jgi:hypothetical protein